MQTTEYNGTTFAVGSTVQIMSESCGWGQVHANHIGIITDISESPEGIMFYLDVPSVTSGWACKPKDVMLVVSSAHNPENDAITPFVTRIKSRMSYDVSTLEERMRNDRKQLKNVRMRMDNILDKPSVPTWDMLKSELEDLTIVDDSTIRFTTYDIYIPYTSRYGTDYDVLIGQFTVDLRFTLDNWSINFFNKSERVRDGYIHPHINSSGSACWGTYDTTIYSLMDRIDVIGAITLIMDFLKSCDRNGWYLSVLNWCSDLDVCPNCECEECECERDNWCHDCDNHQDDCQCTRCPDTYDRLEDDCFPDDGCLNCSLCARNLEDDEWQCWYHGRDGGFNAPIDVYSPTPMTTHRYRTVDEEGNESQHPNTNTGT